MLKNIKILLVLTMAFVLCFASIPTALATPGKNDAFETDQAAITKLLEVPYGTAIPNNMSFKFEVIAEGTNGNDSPEAKAKAAAAVIGDNGVVTVTFSGSQALRGTVAGIDTYYLESAGIFDVAKYPHAGIYAYTIKEIADTYTIADPLHEALTYSQAKYDVKVYVKEDPDNPPSLKIAFIGVLRIIDDGGDEVADQEKLDPTPGGDPNIEGDYSEMTFTNKYIKTNGPGNPEIPDPEDPDNSTLNVSKTVKGLFGSTTMYFDFTLTLNVPDLIEEYLEDYYIAYVVENGAVADPTNNANSSLLGTTANDVKYIKFVSGETISFKLKDSQKLMFVNTPVGTKYTVSEAAVAGYIPNTSVIYNGGTAVNSNNTDANIPYSVSDKYVGEAVNSAAFTNDSGTATPTGLNLNDLPFIGLIALALVSLVVFIAVKSRKKRNTSQY